MILPSDLGHANGLVPAIECTLPGPHRKCMTLPSDLCQAKGLVLTMECTKGLVLIAKCIMFHSDFSHVKGLVPAMKCTFLGPHRRVYDTPLRPLPSKRAGPNNGVYKRAGPSNEVYIAWSS